MKSMGTLKDLIKRSLEYAPDKIAFIEGNRQFMFRDFVDRTYRMGNALLDLGLKKGDRVAILSQNSIEGAESYFSIPNAGLVLVMLNFRLAPPELLAILSDAKVSALIVHEAFINQIEQIKADLGFIKHCIVIGTKPLDDNWHQYETLIDQSLPHEPVGEVTEDDLAALMYTSGTTGNPKGCMVTHRNFYHVGKSLSHEMSVMQQDLGIISAPMFHASGEVILMNGIYSATTTIIMPRWDVNEFMRLVEKYKITIGVLATPMLPHLLDCPSADQYDLSSLKKVLFAGAPVSPEIFNKAIQRFGNIFVHAFGTTETVGSICILNTHDLAKAIADGRTDIFNSCGRAYTGMQVEVVDENDNLLPCGAVGEIRAKGTGVTLGYWNKDEDTKNAYRNGWFYTGDLCQADEHGFMYIVGRKKDIIITGAENVFPAEVENILYKHPEISQSAVVGLDDAKWGEIVTAFVVKRETSNITQDDVISFCRQEIAGYKIPKKVFFVDHLPMNAIGKVLRGKLKEEFVLEL